MELIDDQLLSKVSKGARQSPRKRMNYNFNQSLDDKCHRMLNALEPETEIPVHRHPKKDETFVILSGKVKVFVYNSRGTMVEYALLSRENGMIGVNIPKNTWHTLQCEEPAVLFECKEGPYVPHEKEGILEVKSEK